ncbi:Bug family tripartite tricarboxylate transporter substrate binding protein [Ottowia thiooxydans]|uniref:Bug family tripartite tricarboxylate transporter substrate binding protein n=1 Tax=Ottowia thiooxydans TaxID=219182 RepID=UPI0004066861|nr:tripartite tricarboxylate transporter substrate binding protein [Ottowia thiooxydans]
MRRRNLLTAAISALSIQSTSWAQRAYPSKALQLVVPFPAGGGTDILARHLAKHLTDAYSQPVVVENRAGAGGAIGAEAVTLAAPDGYTLLMTTAGVSSINPGLYPKLRYDAEKQLIHISRVASTVFALIVNPAVPAKSVKELVQLAKAQPGKLSYGSAGNGAAGHLPAELFNKMAGVNLMHVPYRGTSPAINDLMGGQIQVMFAILGAALPFIQSGKVRVLATTGQQRSAALPDVPTVAESGVPGYVADEWWGVAVPTGTPPAVVARLNESIVSYVKDPQISKKMIADGFEPSYDTPTAFAKLVSNDKAKWGRVITDANVKLD